MAQKHLVLIYHMERASNRSRSLADITCWQTARHNQSNRWLSKVLFLDKLEARVQNVTIIISTFQRNLKTKEQRIKTRNEYS